MLGFNLVHVGAGAFIEKIFMVFFSFLFLKIFY